MKSLLAWFCLVSLIGCSLDSPMRTEVPYGELIRSNGRNLHVETEGGGKPLVLFFSDIDMYSAHIQWSAIQKLLGDQCSSVAYDRPGYYWSDFGERPRTGKRISMELESFLAQEGYAGPYILVGHGMGTVYSRIFAVRNREDVKGIVWLDPLNPTALARMEEAGLAMKLPDRRIRPLIRLFIALGVTGKHIEQYGISDELYGTAVSFYDRNSLTWFDEMSCAEVSLEAVASGGDLGSIPLVILTSGKGDDYPELSELWISLQTEMLPISSNSVQYILPETGHYIHLENPETVVNEIEGLIGR